MRSAGVLRTIASEHERLDSTKDKEIIRRFAAGEQDAAFRMLMSSYQRPLYQLTRRMMGNHEDADDALQNTFVKAWKGLPKFREDSKLFSWLYRIASNESLNLLDKRKRSHGTSLDEVTELAGESHISLSGDEIQAMLHTAIETLPSKQKLVFTLKYFQELKYEEIADITGTSVGALKSSFHLAVKKIELYLADRSNL